LVFANLEGDKTSPYARMYAELTKMPIQKMAAGGQLINKVLDSGKPG
jgi:hypothetical protein